MTITSAPTVPNPNSPSFATDAYPFTQWMAALGPEIDAESARINAIGFGAYSASSTTSLAVGTGSKSLTISAGKSFAVGQPVVIASTAGPTNYMTGQVTSYNSGTGALVVNATAIGGSGTVAAWTISVASIVAGGGVSPDSIVVLTSGTSWTCPAGVTKAVITVVGGCGGGGVSYTSTGGGGGGGAGGFAKTLVTLTPAAAYTYSIGSGGIAGSGSGAGGAAGNSTFVVGATTYTGSGGGGGGGSPGANPGYGGAGGGGTNGSINGYGANGTPGSVGQVAGKGGVSVAGTVGGDSTISGNPGKIILELYK